MELRRYLALIGRHRWLVLAVFLVTTGSSIWFVEKAIPVYESTGTFIVRPVETAPDRLDETVDSIDTLIRGAQISATYAKIASSDLIGDAAKATLGQQGVDTSATRVAAEPVTGTNLLEITVSGPDPDAAQALAVEVGEETIDNINGAEDPYELSVLDEPNLPGSPTSPKKAMTIAAAAVFGLMLGVGLALLIEYLRVPVAGATTATGSPSQGDSSGDAPADDPLTGLAGERTLAIRIAQEVSRARHHGDVFGFGLLQVAVAADDGDRRSRLASDDDLRIVADTIRPTVRDEDVLARMGATSFAGLLPGMDLEAAEWAVLEWEAALTEVTEPNDQAGTLRLNVRTAVCEFRDDTFSGDRDAISAARRLIAGRRSGTTAPSTPSPSGERAER